LEISCANCLSQDLSTMSFFVANPNLLTNLKDVTNAIIQTTISIAKDLSVSSNNV
jgi:hypothetical protein